MVRCRLRMYRQGMKVQNNHPIPKEDRFVERRKRVLGGFRVVDAIPTSNLNMIMIEKRRTTAISCARMETPLTGKIMTFSNEISQTLYVFQRSIHLFRKGVSDCIIFTFLL